MSDTSFDQQVDFSAAAVAPQVVSATGQSAAVNALNIEVVEATLGLHAFLQTALAGANNDLDWIARVPGATAFAAASTVMAGANNDITITADNRGELYNDYRFRILDTTGQISTALSVAMVGKEIRVIPATNASGVITSTSTQVQTALNADGTFAPIFTATNSGGDTGAGVVTPYDAAVTAGGISSTNIRITYTISGSAAAAVAVVAPNDINITGGTATTSAQVKAAVEANAAASALVVVNHTTGNDGTGAVITLAQTALAAQSGTTPTADVSLQHDHGEATWDTVDSFAQKTTVLTSERDTFGPIGDRVRWNWTLGGTTPIYALSVTNVTAELR